MPVLLVSLNVFIKDIQGVFGLYFQTTIFSFQTTFHTFSCTFSSTRICTNVLKQQFLVFKHMYQTGPQSSNFPNSLFANIKFFQKKKIFIIFYVLRLTNLINQFGKSNRNFNRFVFKFMLMNDLIKFTFNGVSSRLTGGPGCLLITKVPSRA